MAKPPPPLSPGVYLVATPIGNLEDITERALRVLRECDLIACEDTRHTGRLLSRLGIKKPLLSYHEHNEARRAGELAGRALEGERVAVVSDAGTPGVSDPAYRVVRAAIEAGVAVVPVPGPSSVLAALPLLGPSHGQLRLRRLPSPQGTKKAQKNRSASG